MFGAIACMLLDNSSTIRKKNEENNKIRELENKLDKINGIVNGNSGTFPSFSFEAIKWSDKLNKELNLTKEIKQQIKHSDFSCQFKPYGDFVKLCIYAKFNNYKNYYYEYTFYNSLLIDDVKKYSIKVIKDQMNYWEEYDKYILC